MVLYYFAVNIRENIKYAAES